MRIIKLLLITLCTLAFSCQRYDDSAVWDELKAHAERIAALEALCAEMNSNITALDEIVAALQENEYVTEITDITENGKVIGYTITFSKRGRVAIYHGKAGVPGAPGAPGQDGEDGTDGKDGHTPTIGVRKDTDGIFYWTLDGEWLTDSEGNKIPTTGIDGADGQPGTPGADGQPGAPGTDGEDGEQGKPGQDGEDGITPLLKIEDDYWYISYDNGQTWQQLYKAVGEDGAAGANGTDGAPGKDGQSFFQNIDTTNPNYIILTLADGSQIKIPTWKAFEELQIKVNQMNTNLAALQAILEALQNKDYVTEITQVNTEDGKELGYTIHFSKSQPVTIYHGKDGADGTPGQDGTPGADGENGKDGHTPIIGIKKGSDEDWSLDNNWTGDPATDYYWTIDGEWLLDENGDRIPATGNNGRTPLLKIENGQWFISTDNGKTWKPQGPATGSNVESVFTDIAYNTDYLYLTLANGETITLSRYQEKAVISCTIEPVEITDRSAIFNGHLDVPAEDVAYSQVTVYYSADEVFNIYTSPSITISSFDYNQNFEVSLTGLIPETSYKICVYVKVRLNEMFGEVMEFKTEEADHSYRIPFEYQETDYLGTAGSEYFTFTGLKVSSKVSYEIKFSADDPGSIRALIGAYSSSAEGERSQIRLASSSYGTGIEFMYGHHGAIENDGPAVELTDWSGINTLKVEANKVYWNDELKHTSPEASFGTSATDLTFFAQNNHNPASTTPGFSRMCTVKCYYIKVTDPANNIDMELVPCYRKYDYLVGFYDLKNNIFIQPSGGECTKGNDIFHTSPQ